MRAARADTEGRIFLAAVKLFDIYGYHGTTLRQIAGEAGVNVALIAYYFKNKKGLLEHVMIRYFEPLFERLEEECQKNARSPEERLVNMLITMVQYQREQARITRIIQRELSVESMLGREIMSIYLTKQKHYFISILEEEKELGRLSSRVNPEFSLISLMSMIQYPFLNPQWVREVFYLEPMSELFVESLSIQIRQYVSSLFRKNDEN